MSEAQTIRRVIIRGRVQGVGYRAWTEQEAMARGLSGFVRNRRDGSVEAVFAGPAAIVDEMITACRGGPPSAQVAALDIHAGEPDLLALRRAGDGFSFLPTI